MYFKVLIKPDIKDETVLLDNNVKVSENEISKPLVSVENENDNYLFMVLLANDGESKIDKAPNGGKYDFNFTFPVFSLPYRVEHKAYSTSSENDVNYNVSYNQAEYSLGEIPVSVRREIAEFLSNNTDTKFVVKELPNFEYTTSEGKRYIICFVSCSNLELFNDIYRADLLDVDIDLERSNTYDNPLDSALNYEVPLVIVNKNGSIKTNGVKHTKLDLNK